MGFLGNVVGFYVDFEGVGVSFGEIVGGPDPEPTNIDRAIKFQMGPPFNSEWDRKEYIC